MASYVDPGLYANRPDMHQLICTSCGAIIHAMSKHVHDLFHERVDNKNPDVKNVSICNGCGSIYHADASWEHDDFHRMIQEHINHLP